MSQMRLHNWERVVADVTEVISLLPVTTQNRAQVRQHQERILTGLRGEANYGEKIRKLYEQTLFLRHKSAKANFFGMRDV